MFTEPGSPLCTAGRNTNAIFASLRGNRSLDAVSLSHAAERHGQPATAPQFSTSNTISFVARTPLAVTAVIDNMCVPLLSVVVSTE